MDAVIMAGEKSGAIPVLAKNKAFLEINGKSIIEIVMDALDRTDSIESMTVVQIRGHNTHFGL